MLGGEVKVCNFTGHFTGEWDAVERRPGIMGREDDHDVEFDCQQAKQGGADWNHPGSGYTKAKTEPFEATNLCFFGTAIEDGKGIGIVIRVSDESSIGQIA